jgi:hypothetical protein
MPSPMSRSSCGDGRSRSGRSGRVRSDRHEDHAKELLADTSAIVTSDRWWAYTPPGRSPTHETAEGPLRRVALRGLAALPGRVFPTAERTDPAHADRRVAASPFDLFPLHPAAPAPSGSRPLAHQASEFWRLTGVGFGGRGSLARLQERCSGRASQGRPPGKWPKSQLCPRAIKVLQRQHSTLPRATTRAHHSRRARCMRSYFRECARVTRARVYSAIRRHPAAYMAPRKETRRLQSSDDSGSHLTLPPPCSRDSVMVTMDPPGGFEDTG